MREPIEILFQNRQRTVSVDTKEIRAALSALSSCFEDIVPSGASWSFVLVSDRAMKAMNQQYAGLNESTDVLSFPLFDDMEIPDDPGEIGDVVVSIERAVEQVGVKDRSGHPKTTCVLEELMLLLVHGTLHLVGHDHQDDEGRNEMIAIEQQILGRFRAMRERSA